MHTIIMISCPGLTLIGLSGTAQDQPLAVQGIQIEERGRKITILVDGPLFFWQGVGGGGGFEKFSHVNVMAPELTHQKRPLW